MKVTHKNKFTKLHLQKSIDSMQMIKYNVFVKDGDFHVCTLTYMNLSKEVFFDQKAGLISGELMESILTAMHCIASTQDENDLH